MPEFVLPILYAILFGNIIYRTGFFRHHPQRGFVLGIFMAKCLLSAIYWWVHLKSYKGGDAHVYFMDAEIIGQTLKESPWKYIQLVFGFNGGPSPPPIAREIDLMGYWHDTSAYMVVRFNALVYLFSFGNLYVHGIFMAFVSTVGLVAFYKGLIKALKTNTIWIKIGVFGIPSVLFWTSGVHKEGLLILGLGFFFYSLLSLQGGQRSFRYLNMLVLSALLIFLVRDFVFYLLLPGFFAWVLSKAFPRFAPFILIAVYALFIAFGPQLDFIRGHRNYLSTMAQKQDNFARLENGKTNIPVVPFEPSTVGMVKSLPMAFYNATLRPLGLVPVQLNRAMAWFETLSLLLLLIGGIAFFDFKAWHYDPLLVWFFCFGFSFLCLIGIVVPNIGAIVRYRSIALPFVFLPLLYFIKPVVGEKLRRIFIPIKV